MRGRRQFTDQEVEQIRLQYASGRSQTRLAVERGCAVQVIGYMVRGETYRDAPGPTTLRRKEPSDAERA